MLNLISYPQGRCFLNRLPKIVTTTDYSIIFSLWLMQGPMTEVFAGRYQPDFDGKISIDISDIVKNHLKAIMPANENDLYQSGFEAHFAFKMNEIGDGGSGSDFSSDFIVVNASPNTSLSLEEWCSSHFLTSQPIEKPTNYESPEWLTYYDYVGDWIVVGRFYPKEGGLVDMIVKWDEKPGCWSVNVNYARLIPYVARLPHQLKGFYDIILYDGNLHEFCRQRYTYDERTAKEKYYLFANSLGGIDTLICQGENVLQPELEHNIGRFGKLYKSLDDTEDMRQWEQNIGMKPYRWRNWIYDLLSNKQASAKFDPQTGTYYAIVLKSSNPGMSDRGQLADASFSYIMANTDNLIAEDGRSLSQSAADAADALDDLTTEAVVGIVGGASEAVAINSEKVFVSFAETEHAAAVTYYIDGQEAGSFTPGTDKSPVVVDLPFGASIHFETAGDTDVIVLNWYEGWKEVAVYGFAWSGVVCAELPDPPAVYTYTWSGQVCAVSTAPYTFAWKEDRCVLDAGGWEFGWSEDRCVMEYVYKLIWEEMESPENDNQNS